MKVFITLFISWVCIGVLEASDAVLKNGQAVTIENKQGKLVVEAGNGLERRFTWNLQTRTVDMWERNAPWLGSKSIYFPGPGEHWRDNGGVTRGVIQEGIRRYESLTELTNWIQDQNQSYLDFRYLGEGRIGGWAIIKGRKQLSCEVWKIFIKEKALSESELKTALMMKKSDNP